MWCCYYRARARITRTKALKRGAGSWFPPVHCGQPPDSGDGPWRWDEYGLCLARDMQHATYSNVTRRSRVARLSVDMCIRILFSFPKERLRIAAKLSENSHIDLISSIPT
jgi:hypothetical protein